MPDSRSEVHTSNVIPSGETTTATTLKVFSTVVFVVLSICCRWACQFWAPNIVNVTFFLLFPFNKEARDPFKPSFVSFLATSKETPFPPLVAGPSKLCRMLVTLVDFSWMLHPWKHSRHLIGLSGSGWSASWYSRHWHFLPVSSSSAVHFPAEDIADASRKKSIFSDCRKKSYCI